MRAVLLAAGLGTRLHPLTQHTPKCLVRIGDTPLIDIWLDAFDLCGVDEVLINTHYLADQVREHVAKRSGSPAIRLAHEPTLLGSAGTLRANRDFLADQGMFLVANADNLTDFDLQILIDTHSASDSIATLALFSATNPSACGIVEIDTGGKVVSYVEKPVDPRTNLANAGIYIFSPRVLELITGADPVDIGYNLLPALVNRAGSVIISDEYFADIGTLEALRAANADWKDRYKA